MRKSKKMQQKNRWVWLFSAFSCGIIGIIFAVYLAFPAIYGLWKTRDAVQVPAAIKKWELKGTRSSGKASAFYVEAEYEYQYDNQSFTGTRVSLFKYDQTIYNEHLNNTTTFCFIDPQDPSYSVIDRRYSIPWFLFVIGVPAILLFLSYASFAAFFNKEIPQLKKKFLN